MTIKVYTATICGSQEVRKLQQRVLFILSTLPLDLEIIDITEAGRENDRDFMQEQVKKHEKKSLLPPQIFNNDTYCGDYDDFQLAADDDVIMSFLKLEEPPAKRFMSNGIAENSPVTQNGISQAENENHTAENIANEESAQETGEELVNTSNESNLGNAGNPGESVEDAPKPAAEVKSEEDEAEEEETSEGEEESD